MKWLVLAIILTAATVNAENGPEVLRFKNGVTFPHRRHQNFLKSECRQCHRKDDGTGKIPSFGKEVAHRLCRTCHAMRHAGPASCSDCHKR